VTSEDLIFKSPLELDEGSETTLEITYFPIKAQKDTPTNTVEARVKLLKKGQLAREWFLYKARYVDEKDAELKKFFKYLKQIEATQLEKLVDYHDRREHFRINRVLPVFSKHLREYKCLTKNISSGGIMLACSGGVKKGDVLSIRLELDDYSQEEPLNLEAEVCWIEDSTPHQFLIGLRFLEVGEYERSVLTDYIDSIKKTMNK